MLTTSGKLAITTKPKKHLSNWTTRKHSSTYTSTLTCGLKRSWCQRRKSSKVRKKKSSWHMLNSLHLKISLKRLEKLNTKHKDLIYLWRYYQICSLTVWTPKIKNMQQSSILNKLLSNWRPKVLQLSNNTKKKVFVNAKMHNHLCLNKYLTNTKHSCKEWTSLTWYSTRASISSTAIWLHWTDHSD